MFSPVGDTLLQPIMTRVRPGTMMHSALLIFDDHQGSLASAMLSHISGYEDAVPFAADVFGDFWIVTTSGTVRKVQTETLAVDPDDDRSDLNDWARAVLDDPDTEAGERYAFAWQEKHGSIHAGHRLSPSIPFVLGGSYSLDQVHAIHLAELYSFRTDFALQTRDLPDGARVEIDFVD